jgi:predicted metal-binding membrane protein
MAISVEAGASRASRFPALAPAFVVLAAWAALLVLAVRGGQSAGMEMGARPSPWDTAAAGLPFWLLMTLAMMGPAALVTVRCVARAGSRPGRAMAAFAVGYLSVWAAFGLGAQAGAAAIGGVPGPRALALALLAAAGWQLTPVKRNLLRRHRSSGPQAAALVHGLRYGVCCVGACWCLMLVMVAAPAGQLLWLAGLTALVTAERAFPDRVDPLATAAVLGVAAVATLAVAGLLQ